MNLKELKEKYNALLTQAKGLLEESNKAIGSDEFDRAQELQQEHDEVTKSLELVKGQIERVEADEEARKSTNRLPFDTTEPQETEKGEEKPDSLTDPKYVLKYGEIDGAVKAVIRDLYGVDYNQKRQQQLQIFSKFVRFGESRLTAAERTLANELIVTPEVLKFDIKAGMGVGGPDGLKATLQESVGELGGYVNTQFVTA